MAEPKLLFLPEQHSDFVFTVHLEWAWIVFWAVFVGAMVVLVLRARRRRSARRRSPPAG